MRGKFFELLDHITGTALTTRQKADVQKIIKYMGDIYGYAGTSSPIIAYTHAIQEKEVKEGDYCIFCSVLSGLTASAVLYKAA